LEHFVVEGFSARSRPKVLAGANAYIKRVKRTNLAMEIVLKVLEGAWGNFFQEVPPQKYYANKAYAQEAPPQNISFQNI